MKNRKVKSDYVQDFIPIKSVFGGIIETMDNRYIKILEIEPINFILRSDEEQQHIISAFASWLKISPVKLQFKSVTRKADSEEYISKLLCDIESENNILCRSLCEDYVELIRNIGNNEALTRRFFLIFEYEPSHRIYSDKDIIYQVLKTAEETARSYFSVCGNVIKEFEDENEAVARMLYTFFNRRSCIEESFEGRIKRLVLDTMAAKNLTVGIDDIPEISILDIIAPRGIDLTNKGYIIIDGMYYSIMYIRGNGYPETVYAGWLNALVNAGEGIDIDIHLRRENKGKAVDKVAQKIRLNNSKIKGMQDTSTDYEELTSSIGAGYYIKEALANGDELFYMSIFITVSAKSYDELIWRREHISDMLKSMDICLSGCPYEQEAALNSVMPLASIENSLDKKSRRNVLSLGAASTYMFTSQEIKDDRGILLGVNKNNNSLCIVDFFNTKKHKNANLNIIGTSGAGKTFALQLLASRMRMRGVQCFIIAPIKGHEFYRLCKNIGGTYVKISPGSKHCINIMEIRHTVSPIKKLTSGDDNSESSSKLALKIQQLIIFFTLIIPDITNEEEELLDATLLSTYAKYGITHDNSSIYKCIASSETKEMPTLGDLYDNLIKNPKCVRLYTALSRFVSGSAQSFNKQTNVDLDNDYVVLDLSELGGKLLPIGMMIALDYVWDKIKSDIVKKKAVMIDEIWQLIGATSNKPAAEFCLTIFKMIRGFGGMAVAATQDLSDFFSLDDGKYGRAILNSSNNKMVLNLEPDEAKYVRDVLKLTKTEIDEITHFERGEALICSGTNKVSVAIKASDAEYINISTEQIMN